MQAETSKKEEQHMQGSEASAQVGGRLPSVELALFGEETFSQPTARKPRRARPASAWSMQITLPQVREAQADANGNPVRVRTPEEIAAQCADMATAAQEMFVVFDLNAKNNVIDRRLVTLGILDASLVHPREVFRGAILNNAAAVVVAHSLCGAPHKQCYVKRRLMCSQHGQTRGADEFGGGMDGRATWAWLFPTSHN